MTRNDIRQPHGHLTRSYFHSCHTRCAGSTESVKAGLYRRKIQRTPRQGTSNRRFFLHGLTIELLYISDAEEAAHGTGKNLGILARTLDNTASPFGIVVRVSSEDASPAFPNWQYRPDYFDGKMSFFVGNNSSLVQEPLCICMPLALSKRTSVPVAPENQHWVFDGLKITVPVETPSEVLQQFVALDNVEIQYGSPHKITLKFNQGIANTLVDLSPTLPMTIEH